jgi:hypothetical protein
LNVKGLPTVEEKQKSKEDETVRQQKISILDEENLTPVEEKSIDDIFDMNKKLLMSTEGNFKAFKIPYFFRFRSQRFGIRYRMGNQHRISSKDIINPRIR